MDSKLKLPPLPQQQQNPQPGLKVNSAPQQTSAPPVPRQTSAPQNPQGSRVLVETSDGHQIWVPEEAASSRTFGKPGPSDSSEIERRVSDIMSKLLGSEP